MAGDRLSDFIPIIHPFDRSNLCALNCKRFARAEAVEYVCGLSHSSITAGKMHRKAGLLKEDFDRAALGRSQDGAVNAALVVLVLLALLPLAVAIPFVRLGQNAAAAGVLAFLGRASGILGLSFLLVAALISVRIPGFDLWFGGLTRLWKIHHVLGALSFLLLMAHPLLLAFASAPVSVKASAAVLFPDPSAWSVWAGWLALTAMAVFLAPTFFGFSVGRSISAGKPCIAYPVLQWCWEWLTRYR